MGVSPEVLLAAWGFPPEMAGSLRESLKPYEGHVHPREEQVVVLLDAMSQAWVERFGQQQQQQQQRGGQQ